MQKLEEDAQAILKTDALFMSVPQSIVSKESVTVQAYPWNKAYTYHLVRENLITYPVSFVFLKNSFLFDEANNMILRFVEAGHFLPSIRLLINEQFNVSESSGGNEDEPTPHSLKDLQTSFITLLLGWFIGFLAFATELSIDFCKDTKIFKYFLLKLSLYRRKIKQLFANRDPDVRNADDLDETDKEYYQTFWIKLQTKSSEKLEEICSKVS
ncbi:unnamed protein product [Bemisia tabaci]|uniref:Uncharacterized protein n=1 Tax=Bemisia tabaci TaxID=7038 RepID=A0A9P0A311_BEMTA|nr:unnamed protein product [Bemisia tabaci]